MKINRNDWEDYDSYDDDETFIKKFPKNDSTKEVKKKGNLVRQKRKAKAKERELASQLQRVSMENLEYDFGNRAHTRWDFSLDNLFSLWYNRVKKGDKL